MRFADPRLIEVDSLADRWSRARDHEPWVGLLASPELAIRTAHLGTYVRWECGLPNRWRHLTTMIVARAMDCQYEFTVHATLAAGEGIASSVVEAIDRSELPDSAKLTGVEPLLVRFAHQLVNDHRVDDATFGAVLAALGPRQLADVVLEVTGSSSEVVHEPLPVDDPTQRRPDISLARERLGWEPTVDLREGLERTAAWFRNTLG